VLSRLFRRPFLDKLVAARRAGQLQFFGNHAALTDAQAFTAHLAPLRNSEWVVYSKRPFGGPKQRYRLITLAINEFIRRFLIHVLPVHSHVPGPFASARRLRAAAGARCSTAGDHRCRCAGKRAAWRRRRPRVATRARSSHATEPLPGPEFYFA
jgi:hypothetical protein